MITMRLSWFTRRFWPSWYRAGEKLRNKLWLQRRDTRYYSRREHVKCHLVPKRQRRNRRPVRDCNWTWVRKLK